MKKSILISLYLIALFYVPLTAQWRFPLDNKSTSNFTSPYGPRLKQGTYDFHEGLDIKGNSGDPVYSMPNYGGDVFSATVVDAKDSRMVIKYVDGASEYHIKYTHIKDLKFITGQHVNAGQWISNVRDYPPLDLDNGDHLDLRFDQISGDITGVELHPGRILKNTGATFTHAPRIINADDGTTEITNNSTIYVKKRDGVTESIDFGVAVKPYELSLMYVRITLTGKNINNEPVTEKTILRNPYDIQNAGYINIEERINCGSNIPYDNGNGGVNSSYLIKPIDFTSGSQAKDHLLFFRWYINMEVWKTLVGDVKLTIEASDWNHNCTVDPSDNNKHYLTFYAQVSNEPQKNIDFTLSQYVGPTNTIVTATNISKGITDFEWLIQPPPNGSYEFLSGYNKNSISPKIKFVGAGKYNIELKENTSSSQNIQVAKKLWPSIYSAQNYSAVLESTIREFTVVEPAQPYMIVEPTNFDLSKEAQVGQRINVNIYNQTSQNFSAFGNAAVGMIENFNVAPTDHAITFDVNENLDKSRGAWVQVSADVELGNEGIFGGKFQMVWINQAEVGPILHAEFTPVSSHSSTQVSIYINNTGTGTLVWSAVIDPASIGWIRSISSKNSTGVVTDIVTGEGTIILTLDANEDAESRYGSINVMLQDGSIKTITIRQPGNPNVAVSPSKSEALPALESNDYYTYSREYTTRYREITLDKRLKKYGEIIYNYSNLKGLAPQGSVVTSAEIEIALQTGTGTFSFDVYNLENANHYITNGVVSALENASNFVQSVNITSNLTTFSLDKKFVEQIQKIYNGGVNNIYIGLKQTDNEQSPILLASKPRLILYVKNNVIVDQKKSDNLSFGSTELFDGTTNQVIVIPFGKKIPLNTKITLKPSSDYAPGTTELFHHWEKSNSTIKSILNKSEFTITSGINTFTAVFQPTTRNIVIRNIFDGASTLSSVQNIIQFKDPWLIDATTNNNKGSGADYLPLQSPFNMSNNPTYKGIFLDQEITTGNNYSIRFPSTVQYSATSRTADFLFQSIEGAGVSNLTSPSLSNGLFQSDVVFNNNTATITAFYKGAHFTSSPGALSNTSQRKVVKTPDGTIHMVYESMGKVWYETSVDGGTTWTLANNGNPLSSNDCKSPSIDYSSNGVVIAYQENNVGQSDINVILCNKSGDFVAKKVIFSTQENYNSDLSPIIAWTDFGDDVMVVIKLTNPTSVNGNTANPGLYYKQFSAGSSMIAFDGIPSENGNHLSLTNGNTANYSISVDKEQSFYSPTSSIKFHVASEQDGNINYYLIPTLGETIKAKTIGLSSDCSSPIVGCIEHNNGTPGKAYPIVGWVSNGKVNIKYGLESTTDWTNDAENYSSWSNTYEFGSNVNSVDLIGYANANKTALITWTESSGTIKYVTFNAGVFSSTRKLNGLTGGVHLMQGATATDEALAYYVDATTPPYEIKNTQLVSALPTFSLQSGWNWFSLNCTPPNFAINSLFNQSTFTEDDIIKGQTSYAQFLTGGGWVGSLSGLTTNEMYKIKLSNAINLTVDGDYVDLASNQIPLRTGYNWIAYSPSSANSISNALAPAFLPVTGDKIKSKSLIAEYNGTNWIGSLSLLNPGEGYLYHSLSDKVLQWNNSASPKVVNVPEIAKANKIAVPGWEVNPNKFENNMSVIAELKNVSSFTGDDVLAAFIGNDCRGSATPVLYNDRQLYFLVIHGDNSEIENVRLKFFSGKMKKKVSVIEEFDYAVNKDLGSLVNPVKLTLAERSLEIPTEFNLSQNYPNPFNPSTTIEFGLPESKIVKVEVFNSIGQRVKTLLANTLNAGYHSVTWDGTDDFGITVSSGLYLYRINAGNFSRTRKMMFLK